jgi:hypothetical protein
MTVGNPFITQLLLSTDTVIYLSFVDSLPVSGTLQIESELIYYSGKNIETSALTGVVRGLLSTTPVQHELYTGVIGVNLTTSLGFSDAQTLTMSVTNPASGDKIILFNFVQQVS